MNDENEGLPTIRISLATIAYHLSRLTDIIEAMVRANTDDPRAPVSVSESIGSCPNCDSTDVMQEGDLPKAIFYCKSCNSIWVNNASQFFSS